MERVAQVIRNKKVSREIIGDEDIARGVWAAAVGKTIAAHTSRLKLVRNTLVVEVEDAVWQKQLYFMTSQIVARIRKLTGCESVQDIEFRIAVPRRQAQRAESLDGSSLKDSACFEDDAELISDPVLKKVYKLSRRKAIG